MERESLASVTIHSAEEDVQSTVEPPGFAQDESSDDSDVKIDEEESSDDSDEEDEDESDDEEEEETAENARCDAEIPTCKRKTKLVRSLKKIRAINYALQFCSLLIEAQEMREVHVDQKISTKDRSEYCKQVILSLQEIISHKPVGIVKIICRALCAPRERPCREKEQLLEIVLRSESGEEPTEYLNQLIGTVESVVKLFSSPTLYKRRARRYPKFTTLTMEVEDHEKYIVSLTEFLIAYGIYKIEKVFHGLFCITIKEFVLDSTEVKKIGNTMIGAMPHMYTLMRKYIYESRSTIGVGRLRIRSALQSLRELLADYSVQHESWKELINGLDEVIKELDYRNRCTGLSSFSEDVSDMDDEDFGGDFCNETIEDFYEAGARLVPKEHTWWQRYKAYFIDYM